ncbi:hypothetical protein ONZ45_g1612 [Pleurotus djamor]|nr:hypothetical protein ONZ45_g1612 [Pleurotus djamor]
MKLLSLSFLAFLATTSANIILSNDPSDQLPKIARVNENYSWSLAKNTFTSSSGRPLTVSAQSMPEWMHFDPSTETFSGKPGAVDEGTPRITITAQDGSQSLSATFGVCVTHFPPPVQNIAITEQFKDVSANKALSSVFNVAPHSALSSPNPTLRIPPAWSFSVGFREETVHAPHDLYYSVRQADGSPLPSWCNFNEEMHTLDGFTPRGKGLPQMLSLVLHASDQEGFSALAMPFDIYVAAHELSQDTTSLPTINATAGDRFEFALESDADFMGLLVDGHPLSLQNLTSVNINTSPCPWLSYDATQRVLRGTPPSTMQPTTLDVIVQTTFNQSLHTSVGLALVPSYFTASQIPPIQRTDQGCVSFALSDYFAKSTSGLGQDVDISVGAEPPEAVAFLRFDPASGILSGCLPDSLGDVKVTFTAYSRTTHSTSHSTVDVFSPPSAHKHKGPGAHPQQLSALARKRLALGLGITFGIIGGLCLIGVFFAVLRHFARVRDTALGIEANQRFWSETDKKWYGIDTEQGRVSPESDVGNGSVEHSPRKGMDLENMFRPQQNPNLTRYGNLGVRSPPSSVAGSNVMSKREFMTKIKETVRQVSDQYQRLVQGGPQRPVISRPMLLVPADAVTAPGPTDNTISYSASGLNSTISSPASSTADQSVPRPRVDFRPPSGSQDSPRPTSYRSSGSLESDDSPAEAVVQTATRAMSIRSVALDSPRVPPPVRPRIVPFTSSTRVPVPRMPSEAENKSRSRRVPSQKATVVQDVEKSVSGDDLSLGIHYVRALGADQRTLGTNASRPTISTNARSSFSSLESSHLGHADPSSQTMILRTDQKFNFRVPVFLEDSPSNYTKPRNLSARLACGSPLPKFLRVNLRSKQQGCVEFYGTPEANDMGQYDVEICADERCVARVLLEVVTRL